ncbi:MAG TPA: DinB family protein [Beijerinckiaceae bacterium]|nr:DinB family protein [Beijerinckiaceae bacterium]
MITPDYLRMMARYNRWQNRNLYAAAGALADAQRRADRGAFFGSLHGTLSHLYWGDCIWMHRFSGSPKPSGTIADSPRFRPVWDDLVHDRDALDAAILAWAEVVDPAWLAGETRWFSAAAGRELAQLNARLVVHFFNHQTHHRGQAHAILTGLGARPADTDLILMPDIV